MIVSVGCGNPKGGAVCQLAAKSKFELTVPPQVYIAINYVFVISKVTSILATVPEIDVKLQSNV